MTLQDNSREYNEAVEQDLAILAQASNYIDWLASLALPFCRGRLMEAGAGIGTYSEKILAKCDSALFTDYDPRYVDRLAERFSQYPEVSTALLDLDDPDCSAWRSQFDTVVTFNVLEHIADHKRALAELLTCLKPDGRLVSLVPAMEWLMSSLDRSYGHHRRYGAKGVRALAESIGARVTYLRYYNMLGVAGWIKSMMLGAKNLSAAEVAAFDRRMVPLCRRLESRIKPPFGLGMVFVLSRRGGG